MLRVEADFTRAENFAYKRKIIGKMFAYMRKNVYLCIQKDGRWSSI